MMYSRVALIVSLLPCLVASAPATRGAAPCDVPSARARPVGVDLVTLSGAAREHDGTPYHGALCVKLSQSSVSVDGTVSESTGGAKYSDVSTDSSGAFSISVSVDSLRFRASDPVQIALLPYDALGNRASSGQAYTSSYTARAYLGDIHLRATPAPGTYSSSIGLGQLELAPRVATLTFESSSVAHVEAAVCAGTSWTDSGEYVRGVTTNVPHRFYSWNPGREWVVMARTAGLHGVLPEKLVRGSTRTVSVVGLSDLTVRVEVSDFPDAEWVVAIPESVYSPFPAGAGSDRSKLALRRILELPNSVGILPSLSTRVIQRIPDGDYKIELWTTAGHESGMATRVVDVTLPHSGPVVLEVP